MSDELIATEEATALKVFSSDNGLDPIINQAREAVSEFKHNLSTAAGRKRTASLANKVAKLKTRLDGMGKELVSDWKTKAKAVDANRKSMRDELDALKVEARKPLSDWESEQAKIEAEKAFIAMLEDAYKMDSEFNQSRETQKLMDHMQAIIDNVEVDKQIECDIKSARLFVEQQEKDRVQHEKDIADAAAKKAKLEAEQVAKENADRIEREKQEAIKREQAAIAAQREAERQAIAAQERAKMEAEQAEESRIQAEKDAALLAEQNKQREIQQQKQAKQNAIVAAEQAKQAEVSRQKAEQARTEKENAARLANQDHIRCICSAAKESLMIQSGLTEQQAVSVVKAVRANRVANLTINF